MNEVDGVILAQKIAMQAHKDQKRWGGQPYIEHPQRVASHFSDQPTVQCVAWLHDVVEDSTITLQELREKGFPEIVVMAIDAITKRDGEEYAHYIARVMLNSVARKVKIKDLEDNIPGANKQRQEKYKLSHWLLDKFEEGYLSAVS